MKVNLQINYRKFHRWTCCELHHEKIST